MPGAVGNRGDEYVTLKVMLPDRPDPELDASWPAGKGPRARPPPSRIGLVIAIPDFLLRVNSLPLHGRLDSGPSGSYSGTPSRTPLRRGHFARARLIPDIKMALGVNDQVSPSPRWHRPDPRLAALDAGPARMRLPTAERDARPDHRRADRSDAGIWGVAVAGTGDRGARPAPQRTGLRCPRGCRRACTLSFSHTSAPVLNLFLKAG